jgi:hypothetical protein
MAEIIEIHDTNEFLPTLEAIGKEQETVIAIITGANDPATGKSWCPDCVRAKPNLEQHVIANAKGKIIMAIVKREEWSGRSDHPYKQSALLKAKGVPTMLLFAGGEVVMRA